MPSNELHTLCKSSEPTPAKLTEILTREPTSGEATAQGLRRRALVRRQVQTALDCGAALGLTLPGSSPAQRVSGVAARRVGAAASTTLRVAL